MSVATDHGFGSNSTRPRTAARRSETAQSGATLERDVADAGSSPSPDSTPPLNEDLTLALLERRDLPPETLEQLGQDPAAMKSRKVCVALAAHPRAPRHLALRLLRNFYTADLMQFGLRPSVAADLKHFAAEQLVTRLPSVTLGERSCWLAEPRKQLPRRCCSTRNPAFHIRPWKMPG